MFAFSGNRTTEEFIPFAQSFALLNSIPTIDLQAHLSNSTVGFTSMVSHICCAYMQDLCFTETAMNDSSPNLIL